MHHRDRDGAVERHHGFGATRSSRSYRAEDLRPVGRVQVRPPRRGPPRSRPGPGTARPRRAASGLGDQRRPLADQLRGPMRRGPAAPAAPGSRRAAVRAGRRASVSSIRATSPATSPSPGQQARSSQRASRIASPVSSGPVEVGTGRRRVPLVEDQVRARAARRAAGRAFGPGGGIANGISLSRMVCLARLIRCAMVASGTRKAAAICAVVRPPTARSVSAICPVRTAPDGSRSAAGPVNRPRPVRARRRPPG